MLVFLLSFRNSVSLIESLYSTRGLHRAYSPVTRARPSRIATTAIGLHCCYAMIITAMPTVGAAAPAATARNVCQPCYRIAWPYTCDNDVTGIAHVSNKCGRKLATNSTVHTNKVHPPPVGDGRTVEERCAPPVSSIINPKNVGGVVAAVLYRPLDGG